MTYISGRTLSIHGQRDGSGSFFFLGVAFVFLRAGSAAEAAVDLRFAALVDGEARVAWTGAGSELMTSTDGERVEGIFRAITRVIQ
jgi:hypothetical protein